MKKTVFRILLAVCVFLSVSAIAVSGKTEIAFTATATSAFTDGGYYVLGSGFALSDAGNGALKIVGAGEGDRGLWAFTNETVDANPYLMYEIPEGGAVYKMTVCRQWDVEPEIGLDVKPGRHTINLKELLAGQSTVGYTYVVLYVRGEVTLSGLAIGSDGGETPMRLRLPLQPPFSPWRLPFLSQKSAAELPCDFCRTCPVSQGKKIAVRCP